MQPTDSFRVLGNSCDSHVDHGISAQSKMALSSCCAHKYWHSRGHWAGGRGSQILSLPVEKRTDPSSRRTGMKGSAATGARSVATVVTTLIRATQNRCQQRNLNSTRLTIALATFISSCILPANYSSIHLAGGRGSMAAEGTHPRPCGLCPRCRSRWHSCCCHTRAALNCYTIVSHLTPCYRSEDVMSRRDMRPGCRLRRRLLWQRSKYCSAGRDSVPHQLQESNGKTNLKSSVQNDTRIVSLASQSPFTDVCDNEKQQKRRLHQLETSQITNAMGSSLVCSRKSRENADKPGASGHVSTPHSGEGHRPAVAPQGSLPSKTTPSMTKDACLPVHDRLS